MSTARFNTLENAAGTKSVPVATVVDGSAKAWVNFNGTGTVAIRASFNVTSITDVAVGQYAVNMTTAMPDANYAVVGSGRQLTGSGAGIVCPAFDITGTTSAIHIVIVNDVGTAVDTNYVNVTIFR